MKILKWISFVFLAFLIQAKIEIFNYPLNLTPTLVYIFSFKALHNPSNVGGYLSGAAELKGTLFGAGIGLMEDVLTGSIIGPDFFSKGLIGFISAVIFTDVVFRWTPVLGGIAVIILTLADGFISTGLRMFFTDITINGVYTLQMILFQSVVNIPFGILVKPGNFN
ncbi:MAG: hypothetical protein C0415_03735 [Thermodesulfovibrio sp.]|nr:hypothetical protein [Thermodesulfovibrio sp.]